MLPFKKIISIDNIFIFILIQYQYIKTIKIIQALNNLKKHFKKNYHKQAWIELKT